MRRRPASDRLRALLVTTTTATLCGLSLSACGKAGGATTATTVEAPLTVTVAPLRSLALQGGLRASGVLTPQYEAAVSTQLNGYRVAQVLVDQDAVVAQGQPMARLDDTLLRSQVAQQRAIVAQQQVAAERVDAEAQRVAGLDNQGVLPQEQIVERRLAARSGRATVAAAQAQLDDLMTRESLMQVRAPVAGRVLARMVRPGDIAAPSSPMFRIATDEIVEVNAEVAEADLGRIHRGDHALVTLPSGGAVQGVVRLVSPEVDATTKLGHVRVTLPVRGDLRSGGYARVDFTQATRMASVVPEGAVRFDADGASVLVLQPDDRVHRVAVRTGARAQGMVELIGGPPPGATVLLAGGAFVLDGDRVKPVDAAGRPVTQATSSDGGAAASTARAGGAA